MTSAKKLITYAVRGYGPRPNDDLFMRPLPEDVQQQILAAHPDITHLGPLEPWRHTIRRRVRSSRPWHTIFGCKRTVWAWRCDRVDEAGDLDLWYRCKVCDTPMKPVT